MDKRGKMVKLWFEMWLQKKDLGIADIFSDDVVYTESWGPEYKGVQKIRMWLEEWNTRGTVLTWEIKQFFHKDNQTIVEWYFKNTVNEEKIEEFDGMSLIVWNEQNKIISLKEFGCNINNYDPYQNGSAPQFQEETAMWF